MQNLHWSTSDQETLNADRSSKDEQLFISPFLGKPKNMNVEGG
jgi:hypothetical protein